MQQIRNRHVSQITLFYWLGSNCFPLFSMGIRRSVSHSYLMLMSRKLKSNARNVQNIFQFISRELFFHKFEEAKNVKEKYSKAKAKASSKQKMFWVSSSVGAKWYRFKWLPNLRFRRNIKLNRLFPRKM